MKLIDVSNNNGTVLWPVVHGVGGVYAKRTEGTGFHDSFFAENKAGAQRQKLLFGRYHFARPDRNSPEAEAAFFLAASPDLKTDTLRPSLDFETHPASALWAKRFCDYVVKRTGIEPVYYTFTSLEHELGAGARVLCTLPQWRADYGPNDGTEHPFRRVASWDKVTAHQYTSNGHIPGVHGRVDLSNVYDLSALLMPGPVKRVLKRIPALTYKAWPSQR